MFQRNENNPTKQNTGLSRFLLKRYIYIYLVFLENGHTQLLFIFWLPPSQCFTIKDTLLRIEVITDSSLLNACSEEQSLRAVKQSIGHSQNQLNGYIITTGVNISCKWYWMIQETTNNHSILFTLLTIFVSDHSMKQSKHSCSNLCYTGFLKYVSLTAGSLPREHEHM